MRATAFRTLLCAAAFAAIAPAVLAQAYQPPRTPDGRPDLQGMWTNSSITTLERNNASLPLFLNPEQVAGMEGQRLQQEVSQNSRTNPDEGAPAAGGAIGGYNAFWLDRGMKVGVVNGTARSSWIIEPANGKMPFSDAGRKRIAEIMKTRNEDGPEGMNPADRCLVGSRGSGGPPMLNNIYNNTYQIVQTTDHVMIDVEMMHDARIVRLNQQHKPAPVSQWLGDSVGRWEGDTLVVETAGFVPGDEFKPATPILVGQNARVTERFTRISEKEILYRFRVVDPETFSRPWSAEMLLTDTGEPMFEYACHEANLSMVSMLAGGRSADAVKR